jgi:hypothetical protein
MRRLLNQTRCGSTFGVPREGNKSEEKPMNRDAAGRKTSILLEISVRRRDVGQSPLRFRVRREQPQ